VENDKKGIALALYGLEKEKIPFVIKLKKPVKIYQFFGKRKKIKTVYVKMDDAHEFHEVVEGLIEKSQ